MYLFSLSYFSRACAVAVGLYFFCGRWAARGEIIKTVALCAVPVTAAHGLEPMSARVPWHRAGRNGFHEDFHVLLFLADMIITAHGLEYMGGWR